MWILCMLLWTISVSCMNDMERGYQQDRRESLANANEDALSDILLGMYFSDADPVIRNKVLPKVRRRIRKLKQIPHEEREELTRELLGLEDRFCPKDKYGRRASYHHAVSEDSVHGEFKSLRRHVSKVITDALKEEFDELEERIDKVHESKRRESCQKWGAIICGVVSTILASSTALIVHFVEGDNPPEM